MTGNIDTHLAAILQQNDPTMMNLISLNKAKSAFATRVKTSHFILPSHALYVQIASHMLLKILKIWH